MTRRAVLLAVFCFVAFGATSAGAQEPARSEVTSTSVEIEGDQSLVKDVVGGGILVAIVAVTAIGFARSTRRLE